MSTPAVVPKSILADNFPNLQELYNNVSLPLKNSATNANIPNTNHYDTFMKNIYICNILGNHVYIFEGELYYIDPSINPPNLISLDISLFKENKNTKNLNMFNNPILEDTDIINIEKIDLKSENIMNDFKMFNIGTIITYKNNNYKINSVILNKDANGSLQISFKMTSIVAITNLTKKSKSIILKYNSNSMKIYNKNKIIKFRIGDKVKSNIVNTPLTISNIITVDGDNYAKFKENSNMMLSLNDLTEFKGLSLSKNQEKKTYNIVIKDKSIVSLVRDNKFVPGIRVTLKDDSNHLYYINSIAKSGIVTLLSKEKESNKGKVDTKTYKLHDITHADDIDVGDIVVLTSNKNNYQNEDLRKTVVKKEGEDARVLSDNSVQHVSDLYKIKTNPSKRVRKNVVAVTKEKNNSIEKGTFYGITGFKSNSRVTFEADSNKLYYIKDVLGNGHVELYSKATDNDIQKNNVNEIYKLKDISSAYEINIGDIVVLLSDKANYSTKDKHHKVTNVTPTTATLDNGKTYSKNKLFKVLSGPPPLEIKNRAKGVFNSITSTSSSIYKSMPSLTSEKKDNKLKKGDTVKFDSKSYTINKTPGTFTNRSTYTLKNRLGRTRKVNKKTFENSQRINNANIAGRF
jgi:ribosomal protein S17